MNTAAKVRTEKEQHPDRFCSNPSCLWRVVTRNGVNPCQKHPAPSAPSTPAADATSTARACNRCLKPSGSRVEVRTDTQRVVVCAPCAVTIAAESFEHGLGCVVLPFAEPRQSVFVAGDGFYSPLVADVDLHQRELEAASRRFSDRIRRVISRTLQRAVAARRVA
jgi:hypothetical protein